MCTSRGAALPANVVGSSGCRRVGEGGVWGMLLESGGAVAVAKVAARQHTDAVGWARRASIVKGRRATSEGILWKDE
jgi:hypothetical protein